MAPRKPRGYRKVMLVGVMLFSVSSVFSISYAQVTADTSVKGNLGTVVTSGPNFDITGGTRPGGGTNLFHSFGNFSLIAGESANFLNTPARPATSNILSRVTGGNPSSIFGTINTLDFPGANLFLMNPAGILFGPTAQLNVSGAFHATTADFIRLDDGLGNSGIFYADPTRPTVLSVAPPSAFGFLTANPAAIDVNTLDLSTGTVLMGGFEQTLSFVGGTVNIGAADGTAPGYVLAPAGRVNLVSVASPGEATFDGTGFNVAGFSKLGDVNIRGGSLVDGKDVFIRSGQLTIDNGAIAPQELSLFGLAPPAFGGVVDIDVRGSVNIRGTQFDPVTGLPAGIIVFSGNPFDLPAGEGKVPDVNIRAQSVSISGLAGIQSNRAGPGEPGNVIINADTLSVGSGGSIALFNNWEGPGGNLTVNARDVNLSGDGSPSAFGFEGIGSVGLVHPAYPAYYQVGPPPDFLGPDAALNRAMTSGDSGNINLNLSGTLNVQGRASITTDSRNFGRGGDIKIGAQDIVLVGAGAQTGAIAAQSVLAGDAGNINITANRTVKIQNGFRISSSTFGAGSGGSVTVTAGESITFDGADSRFLSLTSPLPADEQNALFLSNFGRTFDEFRAFFNSMDPVKYPADADLFAVLGAMNDFSFAQIAGELKPGAGGRAVVNTPLLTMNAGTRIAASTGWDGNAGAIEANVGSLFLNGGAALNSTSGFQALTGEAIIGSGSAGAINVNATDTITISGAGSTVSTSTFGDGAGGNIFLSGNQIYVLNGGSVTSQSGGTLGGQSFAGTGLAGNVNIVAGSLFRMVNGSITTQAAVADGGNISITTTGSTLRLTNSQITTSVQSGVGQGGNITIGSAGHPFDFILLGDSQIRADAFGGPGGNINMFAKVYLTSNSVVSASSALSTPGTIAIEATVTDVSGSLTQLPTTPLEAATLMRASCAARLAGGKTSSLVVAGREGLPLDPSGLLPSPLTVEPPVAALAPDEEFPWLRNLLWVSYLSLDPKCLP